MLPRELGLMMRHGQTTRNKLMRGMDQQFGEVARLGWTTRCIDKMWMNVLKVEQ